MPPQDSAASRLRTVPDPAALGFTKPNAAGRQYRHGTMSGYNAGKCRCSTAKTPPRSTGHSAGQLAKTPRADRGPSTPTATSPATGSGMKVWKPALKRAGITFNVRAQDLRHAHASWLLAGGADLQIVKERLGHGSISTTEKYLHTLPDADETALDAFSRIRNRTARRRTA